MLTTGITARAVRSRLSTITAIGAQCRRTAIIGRRKFATVFSFGHFGGSVTLAQVRRLFEIDVRKQIGDDRVGRIVRLKMHGTIGFAVRFGGDATVGTVQTYRRL